MASEVFPRLCRGFVDDLWNRWLELYPDHFDADDLETTMAFFGEWLHSSHDYYFIEVERGMWSLRFRGSS